MTPPYENDIRSHLAAVLSGAFGQPPDALRIRLPARTAHASFRPPLGADAEKLTTLDFGSLYGAPLVSDVRMVNGWILFDFSPAFFSALSQKICHALPVPDFSTETHAENRMRVLSRHEGAVCPDESVFHHALIMAVVAHESPPAYRRAERAALTLFHTIAPQERSALFSRCGALGGALWRLLSHSR
jgi:hypothetical protein